MQIIADEFSVFFSSGDIVLAVVLLLGFVISVMVGVWIFMTRWREHKDATGSEDEGEKRA